MPFDQAKFDRVCSKAREAMLLHSSADALEWDERTGMPIAAGECNGTVEDFCRMFETRAVDVAQPSITKIGGVSAMLESLLLVRLLAEP